MPSISKQTPSPSRPAPNGAKTMAGANKPKSVLDRIGPIGFGKDDGIRLLIYGRSGTGKTTAWATFPKPILAMICSGGDKPGELRSIDTPEYRETIQQVVLKSSSEVEEVVDFQREERQYKTLVLDHTSGLQDLVLKEILGLEELPAQKGWGLASQSQWGQCALQCKEILRRILSLDCHVVLVAQEREFNTDSESDLIAPFVGAGLTPSLVGWVNAAVDYIGQTFLREKEETKTLTVGTGKNQKTIEKKRKVKGVVEYCLRTAPDPTYITKFRVPKGTPLPAAIVDPTFEKIYSLVKGGGKSKV